MTTNQDICPTCGAATETEALRFLHQNAMCRHDGYVSNTLKHLSRIMEVFAENQTAELREELERWRRLADNRLELVQNERTGGWRVWCDLNDEWIGEECRTPSEAIDNARKASE